MYNKFKFRQKTLCFVLFFIIVLCCSLSHALENSNNKNAHLGHFHEKTELLVPLCTILVRGDDQYPPYEYLDKRGVPSGFNVDIIKAISKAMGFSVKIDLGPWDEVRRQAEAGEIDALIGVFNTPERDKLLDFSIPHLIPSYALFVRDNSLIQSIEEAKGTRIIVQQSDLGNDFLLENNITTNIIIKRNWTDVLLSLASGEGDCAIVSRLQGLRLIQNLSIENVNAVGPTIIQRKYSIAVPEGKSAFLAQINEGLSIIKETGEYDQIFEKWFGVYPEQSLTLVLALKYFFWIILPLTGCMLICFAWSWTLRRQVTTKTSALNNELLGHKKTEEILRKRENQLQKIFEILPVGLWFADKDGLLVRGNAIGLQIWGVDPERPISEYGDIKGCYLPSREAIDPKDWALTKTVRDGSTVIGELLEIESFDGKKKNILNYTAPLKNDDGTIDGAVVVNFDITHRTVLENQLLQAQKMEVVGTLAGGIAHDFNNILTAILGYTEMAQDGCQQESELFMNLNEVLEAGHRAKNLVHQILAFSHRDSAERAHLKPVDIVTDVIAMLRPSLPTTIEITLDIEEISNLIFINPSQINQILMNLCTNAFHAMEENGGNLNISLKEVVLNERDFTHAPQLKDGTFIQLSISDTGVGIDPHIKSKVFEPFFTTKEVGKGTGMGLSIIHGIVKNSGGTVSFDSKVGYGTTFHVFLPVAKGETVAVTDEVRSEMLIGNERVLLVDDEKVLTRMGKNMLQKYGYQVTIKNCSLEALEVFKNHPDNFDIIITDQTMPEMTGCELSRRMLQIRQDIPIVLCTGFSTIISEDTAKAIGIKEFAFKPLGKKELAKLIRKVLDVS